MTETIFCDSKNSLHFMNSYIFQFNRNYIISDAYINEIFIPNSCFIINNFNDKFEFIYDNQLYRIIIPIGDYDINELLNVISDEISKLELSVNFTFKYNKNIYRVIIETDNDIILLFNCNLGNILGFKNKRYEGNKFISDKIIKVCKTSYYKLRFDEFNSEIILINNVDKNDYLYYNQCYNLKVYCKKMNFNQLTVKIYDEFNNIVDLNGLDFYFRLNIIYDKEKFQFKKDLIKDLIIDTIKNE